MNRNESGQSEVPYSLAELGKQARELGEQALSALSSFGGGVVETIAHAKRNKFSTAVRVLALLGLTLGACAPLATTSPESTDPTATLPAEIEPTLIISTEPAGVGATPGTEVVSTPSPDTGITPQEIFVPPTLVDLEKVTSGEAVPPDEIKDEVQALKVLMSDPALKAEVAAKCGVPANTLNAEYHEGSIGAEFRWTVLLKGVGEDGQTVTCWTIDAETGELTQYPMLFDLNGRVLGLEDGASYVGVSGEMDWAGTTPVLLDPETKKWIVPAGYTVEELAVEDNWERFEDDVLVSEVGENPIEDEKMKILLEAGYSWDSETDSLINRDGYTVLTLKDGQLLDTRTGVETSVEALKLHEVEALDFQGREIVTVLTREVEGEVEMYNPVIDAWQTPIDVAASQEVIDRPDLPPATRTEQRSYKEVVLENLPEITWDDFHSGRLFYSELLNLRPWPEDVRDSNFVYKQKPSITNVWTISQYSEYELGMERPEGVVPIVAENDAVRNLAGYRMESPTNGTMMVVKSQQYYIDGKTFVLHLFFTDELADPDNVESSLAQMSLSNPSMRVTEPIVNVKPDDWCGPGGLDYAIAQPTVCTLQGYDNLDMARDFLPPDVKRVVEQNDVEGQLTYSEQTWSVGDEIARLQQLPLPQDSFEQQLMHQYLMTLEEASNQ